MTDCSIFLFPFFSIFLYSFISIVCFIFNLYWRSAHIYSKFTVLVHSIASPYVDKEILFSYTFFVSMYCAHFVAWSFPCQYIYIFRICVVLSWCMSVTDWFFFYLFVVFVLKIAWKLDLKFLNSWKLIPF